MLVPGAGRQACRHMIWIVVRHRPDDRKLIRDGGRAWQQFRKLSAGQACRDCSELTFDGRWPIGFWVECLLLRMAAMQVEHDYAAGFSKATARWSCVRLSPQQFRQAQSNPERAAGSQRGTSCYCRNTLEIQAAVGVRMPYRGLFRNRHPILHCEREISGSSLPALLVPVKVGSLSRSVQVDTDDSVEANRDALHKNVWPCSVCRCGDCSSAENLPVVGHRLNLFTLNILKGQDV